MIMHVLRLLAPRPVPLCWSRMDSYAANGLKSDFNGNNNRHYNNVRAPYRRRSFAHDDNVSACR